MNDKHNSRPGYESKCVYTLVVGSGHARLLTKRTLASCISPQIVGHAAVLRSMHVPGYQL